MALNLILTQRPVRVNSSDTLRGQDVVKMQHYIADRTHFAALGSLQLE